MAKMERITEPSDPDVINITLTRTELLSLLGLLDHARITVYNGVLSLPLFKIRDGLAKAGFRGTYALDRKYS